MPEILPDATPLLQEMYNGAGIIRPSDKPQIEKGVTLRRHPSGMCNYARKALTDEVARVRRTTPGSRTLTLLGSSYRLGRLVTEGHITELDAIRELENAGRHTGLPSDKVAKTVSSGIKKGMSEPKTGINCHPALIKIYA